MKAIFTKLILSMGTVLLAASCVRETGFDEKPDTTTNEERTQVTLQVKVPARTLPGTRAAADEAMENNINTLVLYIATDENSDGVFYMDSLVVVDNLAEAMIDATTARFQMTVHASATPVKFIAVANMDQYSYSSLLADLEDGYNPFSAGTEEVESWKTDYSTFTQVFLASAKTQGMTMAGEATLPYIRAKGDVGLHIPMLRAVARADLKLNLGADSKPFKPVSVKVYRQSVGVYAIAEATAYDPAGTGKVTAPSFNPTATAYTPSAADVIDIDDRNAETGLFHTTYLPEAVATPEADRTLQATCIVVGGKYNGSETTTYYRIDFNSELEGHPFGQVLRNWKYIFDITKVSSIGYPTELEAATNPAHSMTVQLQMWDENVQSVNFIGSGDYMYVNNNNVQLAYSKGSQNTFVVRSTLPFEWQLGNDGAMMASTSDDQVSNANYIVAITHREDGTGYVDYTFTVTAQNDNTTSGNKNEAGVFLYVNEAMLSVNVTQKSMSVTDRKVHVLSLTDGLGTLGIYYEGAPSGNTAVSAYHMRSILQNKTYFGPESAFVKFGGFTYDQYTTTTILTTSTISLDQLRRALEPADIVILPYLCNLPQSAVDVVYEWAQKPYHVLFVFADIESTTNTLMRKKLDSNLAWYTTGTLSLTTSNTNNSNMVNALGNDYLASLVGLNGSAYTMNIAMKDMIMASQTTDNMAIMGGPFGMPDQGATSTLAQYPMWDGYSQFAVPGVGSNVTPLAVFEGNVWGTNKTNTNYTTAAQLVRTKASLVSVDMPRTIVYIGESVLFLDYLNSTAPYDGSGVAGTPYKNSMTVLMSNIWAWAVKNVLAQIKEED